MPFEHERAKYAELFSLIYARTGTSTLKEAFRAIKSIIDTKSQGDQTEMLLVLDFYLRASLEVTSLIKKMQMSPDSIIQMAMQLAFWRDQKKFGLTYA